MISKRLITMTRFVGHDHLQLFFIMNYVCGELNTSWTKLITIRLTLLSSSTVRTHPLLAIGLPWFVLSCLTHWRWYRRCFTFLYPLLGHHLCVVQHLLRQGEVICRWRRSTLCKHYYFIKNFEWHKPWLHGTFHVSPCNSHVVHCYLLCGLLCQ